MAIRSARSPIPQDAAEPLGRRAQSKLDKRQRILRAAREVFAEKGFPAATMHQIADRAGVAVGTLFLHARSKEDLLLSAFWSELAEVIAEAAATVPGDAPVLGQLRHVFGALTAYHQALGADLSAVLLQELMYGDTFKRPPGDGPPRPRTIDLLRDILERGRTSRELRAGLDIPKASEMLFSIYHWELTHWSVGRLEAEAMNERLQYKLGLCIKGLAR